MRILATVFLMSLFLVFGCLNIEVTTDHVQNSDGTATVTQTTDMTYFINFMDAYLDELGSTYGSSYGSYGMRDKNMVETMEGMCKDAMEQDEFVLECNYNESGIVTIKKKYTKENAFYKFETRDEIFVKKYRLTIDALPQLTNETSSTSTDYFESLGSNDNEPIEKAFLTGSDAEDTANTLETFGMSYNYEISMPGTVTSANGGEIKSNKAVFDIIKQLKSNKEIVVESEELQLLPLMFAGIVGVVILLGLIVVLWGATHAKN